MALQKTAYAAGIEALLEELYTNPSNISTAAARTKFANDFATLTETFVKTGTVPAGITLTSTGTAAAHTGATTGIGTIV